jgi:crotonobetainyl-CoA:carnitine CoA-transferase CaiB-like acyl-CoA transferase
VVHNSQDLIEKDPQLEEREFLVPLQHPLMGVFGHPTPPWWWLKTKANVRSAACLGEHTHYMCTELLGISDEESVKLIRDEVLA